MKLHLLKTPLQLLFVLLLFGSQVVVGQTNIFTYANTTATIPAGFVLTNNVATNAVDQSTYLLVDAGNPSDYIVTPNYDLSAYTAATINVNVATFGSGTAFPLKVEFSTNGGTSWNVTTYTTATPSSSTYITGGPIVVTQTFTTTTKFRFSNNGTAGRGVRIQSLVLDASGSTGISSTSTGGNWDSTATWVGGVIPTSSNNAIIVSGATVTMNTTTGGYNVRNSGTTTTVNTGGTLATNVNYTNNGVTTINGSFQLNAGGWASGSNFVYGAAGALNFNNTSSYGVNSTDVFWPTTSGPTNVSILQGGLTLNSGANRTVTGLFQTAAGVTLSSATLILSGTAQLNAGGFFNNAPTYGSASTLVYNTTYGVGTEWTGNSTTAGVGVPFNVTVQNSATVTMPAANRGLAGSLSIASGNLTLNSGSGDLYIAGNWTRAAAATFTHNNRAVFYNGSGTQTITVTGGGTATYGYLIVDKATGNVQLSSSPATSLAITANAGGVLQLNNIGNLDINGQTLTMANNGGEIQVNGARTLVSTLTGGTLAITGNKSVTGVGTLSLPTNVTTILTAGLNFGASKTTVVNKLQINAGGYVDSNAPIYGTSSTLEYNGVTAYGINTGWTGNATTAGNGTPQNVTITNSSVTMPSGARALAGILTISTGSSMTLEGTSGSDLSIGGNWSNSGTFNANNRLVEFRGTASQTITGATTFAYLKINNSHASGVTLSGAASSIIVNSGLDLTLGKITLGTNDLTMGSVALFSNQSATSYIVTSNTGQLVRSAVSSTAKPFPVGTTTSYTPITITNTGTTNDLSLRVVSPPTNTTTDATKIINLGWNLTSGGAGAVANITFNWNAANQAASYNASGTGELGNYMGTTAPYIITAIGTMSGTSKAVTGIAIASGLNKLVLGNTSAVYLPPAATLSTNATTALSYGSEILLIPSASQTFNLSGANLVGAPGVITVTAPNTNFQVSNNNTTWGATTTIAFSSGTLSTTPVYVRFVPQSMGAQSGNLTFSGGNVVSPPTISLTGSGVLGAPVATAATNITATPTFDANWNAVTGASSGYLLDVSTSPSFGTIGSATITEGFDAGATAPSGWTFTSVGGTYTSAGNYGVSSPSLRFDGTGQQVITSLLSGSATALGFWIKGQGTNATSALLVEGYNGVSWVTLENITSSIPLAGTDYLYNSTSTPALPSNIVQFRFTYTKSSGNLAFDDVSINYATSTPNFVTGYNAKPIAGQATVTSTVSGLEPDTVYYYRLRATDGTTPSAYSNVITVNPVSRGGSVTADQSVCSGAAPTTLTLSGHFGNVIRWESSTDAAFTAPTTITNTTTTLTGASIGVLTATTYFRAVVQNGANPIANSAYATITVNPLPTLGTITATAACENGPSFVTLTGCLPSTAGSFVYTNSFIPGVEETVSAVSDAAGNFTFSTPNIPLIAHGATITIISGTATATGCTSTFTGKTVTVVVNTGAAGGMVLGSEAICTGASSGTLFLTGNGGTIVQWESAVSPFTTWDVIANTGVTYTSGPLTETTQFRAVLTDGTCDSRSAVATATVTTTTYSSTGWSDGIPTAAMTALFEDDFTSTADIAACSLEVSNNANVIINAAHDVVLEGRIVVGAGSSFTLNNNANLIQNTASSINIGNIVVKRNSSALKRLDYTLWSAPVSGQGLYAFSPFTFANRFYTYVSSTDTYAVFGGFNITNLQYPAPLVAPNGVNGTDLNNATFGTAQGYLIRTPWDHPTAPVVWNGQFTGTPNTGNQTFFMNAGYNAVGNPYPSPINVHNFIDANTSTSGTLYFYRKTNGSGSGTYATVTKLAYTANTGAAGGDTGTGFFPEEDEANWTVNTGQGFFVESTTATNLNFTNSMRRGKNSDQFFKTAATPQTNDFTIEGLYWLNLTNDSDAFSQMAVGYSPQATLGFDRGIDGKNLNSESSLTSLIDADQYAVQGRPQFQAADVVPLSYKAVTSGNYTISLDHTSGLFSNGQMIYLKDNVTDAFHALNGGSYTFASEAGTFNNRFEVYYQTLLNTTTPTFTEKDVVLYTHNNQLTINSGAVNMSAVKIFDIRGRLLTSLNAINAATITTTVGQTNEVLLVQITDTEGTTVTKKVIK